MALLKKIGSAVNAAEEWAAKILAEALPESYRIYTNFQLVAGGQAYEVDLAVLSDYTIHLLDVKGYVGGVSYDQKEFCVDGQSMGSNALGKIGFLSRNLAGEWKKSSREGCPWMQGGIFVTGNHGESLVLDHPDGQRLNVHGPDSVVDYLMNDPHPHDHNRITKEKVLTFERLLNMPTCSANETLSDFKLIPETEKALHSFARLQEATHQMNSLPITYQLFMVDREKAPSTEAFKVSCRMLRERYKAMFSLRGVLGVPRCLPPFVEQDGQLFVLPVEKVSGRNLAAVSQDNSIPLEQRINLFLNMVRIVNEAHQRDIFTAALNAKTVSVTESMEPIVQSWVPENAQQVAGAAAQRDVTALAQMGIDCFTEQVWQDEVGPACPELTEWCEEVLQGRYQPIESLLSALERKTGVSEPEEDESVPFEIRSGAVINGHYELQHRLGEGASGEVWAAKHLLGDFECCVKIITIPYGAEELARTEFETLTQLFHPNIVRLFAYEQISGTDRYCLIMGMGEKTLREVMDDGGVTAGRALKWFEGLLSALQYLRRLDPVVVHGDIKPRNMVVTDNHASLIDFNLSENFGGALRYLSPRISGEHQSDCNDDLYAVCLSFYELLVGYPGFEAGEPEFAVLTGQAPEGFPSRVWDQIKAVLNGSFPSKGIPLKEWFRLSGFVPSHEQPLPEGFEDKWNIHRDERFIISTLLQNGGTMSKAQLIATSAKWAFGHVGASDKNRINPRLSKLRDEKGLIDYPRGRQKKGARIKITITDKDLLEAWNKVCG